MRLVVTHIIRDDRTLDMQRVSITLGYEIEQCEIELPERIRA